MRLQPTLRVDHDAWPGGAACVGVHNLDPERVAFLGGHGRADRSLPAVLRVNVIDPARPGCGDLPDVFGRYEILETGLRFIPHFPFEPGVRYCARFDPRSLWHAARSDVLTLEFSLPNRIPHEQTAVSGVFPSADVLPENLLRFYVCFSHSMQRGRAEQQVRLFDADGRPAPDVLYRPPVELWDRNMRRLTVLLDPGRLKRWVGPNRDLGPPLEVGQRYVLAIGPEMIDSSGRALRRHFHKPFVVAEAVREPIAVEQWKVLPPVAKSRQPLTILFPRLLDWAMLWHAIAVVPDDGPPIPGRVSLDRGERRWCFAPERLWAAGSYFIRVASYLEDVCGNSILSAFDRPLRPGSHLTVETATCMIPFRVKESTDYA